MFQFECSLLMWNKLVTKAFYEIGAVLFTFSIFLIKPEVWSITLRINLYINSHLLVLWAVKTTIGDQDYYKQTRGRLWGNVGLEGNFRPVAWQHFDVPSFFTSNDTHSSGDMLVCLMLSRNCRELEMLYSDLNGIPPEKTGTREGPLPTQRRWNIVYSIPCSECPSACVGQTGRQFATRMTEHH